MGVGCAVVATTDSSVVGKTGAALPDGVGGAEALSLAGEAAGPALIFASVSCCSLTCCWSAFTVSVSAWTCWRNASTSLGEGDGDGLCAKTAARAYSTATTVPSSHFISISSAPVPSGIFPGSNRCVRRALDAKSTRNARAQLSRAKKRGSAQSLGKRRRRVLEEREEVVARKKCGNSRRQDREKRKSSRRDADRRSSRRVTLSGGEERHDTEVC